MEVLRDPEQRAAYDHLLDQARQELVSQRIAAKIRNFAFAMISLASVCVVAVGLHLLFAPMSTPSPQVRQSDGLSGTSPETGSGSLSDRPAVNDNSTTTRSDAETKKPVEKQDDFLTRWGADDINPKAERKAETATPAEPQKDVPPRSDATDNNAPADRKAEATTPAATPNDHLPQSSANDSKAPADRNAATATPAATPNDHPPQSSANDSNAPADRNAATATPTATPNDHPPQSSANDSNAPADRNAATATPAATPNDHPPQSSANDSKAPADRNAESATAMKEQEAPVVPPSGAPPPHNDADDVKALIEPYDETDAGAVMHAKGLAAYRKGDLKLALADLNRAIELKPNFMLAYINRGIVLYRMGKLDLALADVARARRIDRADRSRSVATFHRKRRHDASLIESLVFIQEAGQ